jgi:two-component sensor histidine kinase
LVIYQLDPRQAMREPPEGSRSEPAAEPPALEAALERERARAREVDHRAKNSLQLISSLLLLRSRRSAQAETRLALEAMHHRVLAIAAVHRELLAAERPDRFDLTRFVRVQVADLAGARAEAAEVRLDLDAVEVDAAAAAPLALILNELVSNALRYAGGATRAPSVAVSLHRCGGGFALAVEDDGPGLPEGAASTGFGLTMVRLLAQQLHAGFVLEAAQPGLRAVVTAP